MTRKTTNAGPRVLDLTEDRFERVHSGRATPEEEKAYFGEVMYKKALRDLAEKGTADATADLSAEDEQVYQQFLKESGMTEMLGLKSAATAADLSTPTRREKVEASGTYAGEEDAMWHAFVAQSGTSWMFSGDAGGGPADLSEDGRADEQDESDELRESLRRQAHQDAYGEGSDLSDEAAWASYQAALGQS